MEGSLREVHDAVTEMIRQLANEPSVGLYFVQQHVQKAVPAMVQLKRQIVDSTQEAEYVTQDVRDALNSVKTMKECGPAVIERMMKTLDSSVPPRLPSFRQIRRDEKSPDSMDSMRRPSLLTSEMQINSTKSLSGRELPVTTDSAYTGYVRNIFDSAYQKASSVALPSKWTSSSNSKTLIAGEADIANSKWASSSNSETPISGEAGDQFVRADSLGAASTSTHGDEPQRSHLSANKPLFWNANFLKSGQDVREFFSTSGPQIGESWGAWLPTLPTQALITGFSKISGGKAREEVVLPENPASEPAVSINNLLELEGDSYAAFTEGRAAQLEQWLDEEEGEERRP